MQQDTHVLQRGCSRQLNSKILSDSNSNVTKSCKKGVKDILGGIPFQHK